MKSFKIVALQIVEGKENVDIPLTDGLVINKENSEGNWIIEAYVKNKFAEYFQSLYNKNESFEIRVIITHTANDPALFYVEIHKIVSIKDHLSILFKGRLSKRRNEYLAFILKELIDEGLKGEELLEEFRKRLWVTDTSVANE